MILKKIFERKELVVQFVKFGLVGTLGTIIDFGLLNLLYRVLGVYLYLSASISFIAAVINNYLFNKHWTFKKVSSDKERNVQFMQFFVVSVIGLAINLGVMFLLVERFGLWYNWAKAVAIIVVLFWNFWANKLWTFRPVAKKENLPGGEN